MGYLHDLTLALEGLYVLLIITRKTTKLIFRRLRRAQKTRVTCYTALTLVGIMMVSIKRLLLIAKRNRQRIWLVFLLLYSLLTLTSQFVAEPLPASLQILFLVFVPGYAFTEALLPQFNKLEKVTVSVAISLALPIGFKSLVQDFMIERLLPATNIVEIIAAACLVTVVIRAFRK